MPARRPFPRPRPLPGAIGILVLIALGVPAPAAGAEIAVPTLNAAVPMRDGVTLSTDVHLPGDGTGRYPVLLRRTPYGRALEEPLVTGMGALGYANVSQDVRGRGDSQGRFLPFFDDRTDGPDTMAWIAAQPWSDGRIATWGGSAEGIVQLMALPDAPDALRCANVAVATGDVYDGMFPGGAWRAELTTAWLKALDEKEPYDDWRQHEAGDAYWDPARLGADEIARIRVPVLLVGGFFDIFAPGTPRTHARFQQGAAAVARDGQYLVLGPWTHGGIAWPSDGASPLVEGEVSYPGSAGYRDQWWDFLDLFDWCLQDGPRPTWAPVRYALTRLADDGRAAAAEWRTAPAWPPDSREVALHLHDDGVLRGDPPSPSGVSAVLPVDPTNPVPSRGGGNLTTAAGPMDQSPVDGLAGVLAARTPVADVPVSIEGNLRARIWASSSTDDGDVVVRISQATPSGRTLLLADGVRRGRFVGGTDAAVPLSPGVPVEFDVDLGPIAIELPAGHALQVSIAGTSSPRYEPNPGTSAPLASKPSPASSSLTVLRDAAHPSVVTFPVTRGALPGEASAPGPDPAADETSADPAPDPGTADPGPEAAAPDAPPDRDEDLSGDAGDAVDADPPTPSGDVPSADVTAPPCTSKSSGCASAAAAPPGLPGPVALACLACLWVLARRRRPA